VLLVEDHPTMRASLRAVLESEGHEVLEAADGREALEVVASADVVVLDLQVPVVPGDEVLRRLRGDPATARLPVVVVTATGEEGRRAALALGADDYLTKPFGPDVLLRTIERVLPSAGSSGASR
jgi:two-component system phosphate regulon response regulator PhoB